MSIYGYISGERSRINSRFILINQRNASYQNRRNRVFGEIVKRKPSRVTRICEGLEK
jgi:hypothetical protein